MTTKKRSAYTAALSIELLALTALPQVALAEEDEFKLDEIMVTATRFATSAQDVPLAISAMGGDELRDMGVTDPRQLSSLAPGLVVDQGQGGGQTHASIRGLASTDFGLGAQSPVAIYIDDIYQPFQYGLATQSFDLDRIEVLRGPQSTLFGKNTTGGGISYYSKSPTRQDEGYLQADVGGGQYAHRALEGAFNKVLSDTLAARLSFRLSGNSKYVKNLTLGTERGQNQNYNGRLQFAWEPSSATKVELKLFALHSTGDAPVYVGKYNADPCLSPTYGGYYCGFGGNVLGYGDTPVPESIDSTHVYGVVPTTYEQFKNRGATLKYVQSIGDYQLTSITNFQKADYRVGNDDNGLGADAFHSRLNSQTRQASEELRLNTPAEKPVRAVVGLFAMYDRIDMAGGGGSTVDPNGAFPLIFTSKADQRTTTWAAFGALTYDVTSRFSLVGGLRYSSEKKEVNDYFLFRSRYYFDKGAVDPLVPVDTGRTFVDEYADNYDLALSQLPAIVSCANPDLGPCDADEVDHDKQTWTRTTGELTANFKPTDDQLVYGKIATGFRSGGFPIGLTASGTFKKFEPEKVTSYEVGYKSEWLDHRVRFNGAVYYADYKDMQVQVQAPGNSLALIRENAASAKLQGVELELQAAVTQALKLKSSFGYSGAEFKDYETPVLGVQTSLKGKSLPFAPKYTANLGLDYSIPLDTAELTLGTDWNYRSKIYFDASNFEENMDPSRVTGNVHASLGYDNNKWVVTGYVDNVTDRDVKGFGYTIADAPDYPVIVLNGATYNPGRLWGLRLNFNF